MSSPLPGLVVRAVQPGSLSFGEYVEDVLAAPGIGIRIVLHRAHPPFRAVGERVLGNLAQEAYFLAAYVHALYQRIKVRRITFTTHLDLEGTAVGGVFVAID